jgi:hypothetical protein
MGEGSVDFHVSESALTVYCLAFVGPCLINIRRFLSVHVQRLFIHSRYCFLVPLSLFLSSARLLSAANKAEADAKRARRKESGSTKSFS